MFFSGIADEAGRNLDTQIRAHLELGWHHIEIRNVGGIQFTEVSDGEFEEIAAQLQQSGLQVSCFASAIANWSRHIDGDFSVDVQDLERCIPRMQTLNCPFIRVMSWPNQGEGPLGADAWKQESIRRMRELARRAEEGGVTLVLENCDGWAAESARHMIDYLHAVGSDALKVVFDTGNAPGHGLHSLDFYTQVKPYIAYVHIKDAYVDSDGRTHFTWPNEGCGYVRQIVTDLLRSGYDGGLSIEPHLKAQVHLGSRVEDRDQAAYDTYVEYGRRLATLVQTIREQLS